MTSEAGSSQPPPESSDKQQAAKPAAGSNFSAFVNKSGTGRAFKPKAPARRRPAAAQASQAPVKEPAAPSAPQTEQSQRLNAPAEEPQATPQPALPTPAATQEAAHKDAPPTEQPSSVPPPAHVNPDALASIPSITTRTSPEHPTTFNKDDIPGSGGAEALLSPSRELDVVRETSPERPQLQETPAAERTETVEEAGQQHATTETPQDEVSAGQPSAPGPPTSIAVSPEPTAIAPPPAIEDQSAAPPKDIPERLPTSETSHVRPTETVAPVQSPADDVTPADAPVLHPDEQFTLESRGADETSISTASQATGVSAPTDQAPPQRKRRILPWLAVNRPRPRPPTSRPRSKRKTKGTGAETADDEAAEEDQEVADEDEDEEEEEEEEEDEEAFAPPPKRKAPSAKARRKSKATNANTDEGAEGPPAKKPRKVRKDKGTPRKKSSATSEEPQDAEQAADENASPGQKKVSKKRKRSARQTTEGSQETQGEASGADADGTPSSKKRKGRVRVRAPTPSDAEDEEIDPGDTFMDDLASRNIKVGRLSEREKKMRGINWKEVIERRREEGERELMVRTRDPPQTEAAPAEEDAGNAGLQMHVINGEIRYIHGTGVIDREGDAEREREGYRMVEEDDLTRRVNSRSWLYKDKRFPEDYLGIAQGRPFHWNAETTARFYDALDMFGTDFKMISTLFPGSTRRSIKRKFNKEERENPEGIIAALRREGQPTNLNRRDDWNQYLEKTGQTEDSFLDVQAVYAELEQEARAMQVEIDAAKARREEENRQKRLAGVNISDEEGRDGSAKENKRKKSKGKQPVYDDEEGVEILGDID